MLTVKLTVKSSSKIPWLKVLDNISQGVLCRVEWVYYSLWQAIDNISLLLHRLSYARIHGLMYGIGRRVRLVSMARVKRQKERLCEDRILRGGCERFRACP